MLAALPAVAQWVYHAPNIPRTKDGKPNLTAPAPKTAAGLVDLSGIWQTHIKFNANLAADLRADQVPMLPGALALYNQRQANHSKDDPEGFCLPPGVPRASGVPFPEKIIQTPTEIVILYETRTTFRQIFLDSHTVAKDPQPTWMGYSTGKWDGDTLVVQTTGFNDRTWLDDVGHPHSEAMNVTERFRRPDFGHLFIDITIDDPIAYSRPWTVTEEFALAADDELLEYACGENNVDPVRLQGK
ncbi:MAG: hypothetical protein ABI995_12455 [Acidobacteriota bacterium]